MPVTRRQTQKNRLAAEAVPAKTPSVDKGPPDPDTSPSETNKRRGKGRASKRKNGSVSVPEQPKAKLPSKNDYDLSSCVDTEIFQLLVPIVDSSQYNTKPSQKQKSIEKLNTLYCKKTSTGKQSDYHKVFATSLWQIMHPVLQSDKNKYAEAIFKFFKAAVVNVGKDINDNGNNRGLVPLLHHICYFIFKFQFDRDNNIRVRVMELVAEILRYLNSCESNEDMDMLRRDLLERVVQLRIRDKVTSVRTATVYCLPLFKDNILARRILMFTLSYDPSPDTRKTAVSVISQFPSMKTAIYIQMGFDVSETVRAEAFLQILKLDLDRIADKADVQELIYGGLTTSARTRVILKYQVFPDWLHKCENNLPNLFTKLGVAYHPKTCRQIIDTLYPEGDSKEYQEIDWSFLSEGSKVVDIGQLTLERTQIWLLLCQKFSRNPFCANLLLPDPADITKYLKRLRDSLQDNAKADGENYDQDSIVCFAMTVKLCDVLNFEECARREMVKFLRTVLLDPVIEDVIVINPVIDLAEKLINTESFNQFVVGVLSELFGSSQSNSEDDEENISEISSPMDDNVFESEEEGNKCVSMEIQKDDSTPVQIQEGVQFSATGQVQVIPTICRLATSVHAECASRIKDENEKEIDSKDLQPPATLSSPVSGVLPVPPPATASSPVSVALQPPATLSSPGSGALPLPPPATLASPVSGALPLPVTLSSPVSGALPPPATLSSPGIGALPLPPPATLASPVSGALPTPATLASPVSGALQPPATLSSPVSSALQPPATLSSPVSSALQPPVTLSSPVSVASKFVQGISTPCRPSITVQGEEYGRMRGIEKEEIDSSKHLPSPALSGDLSSPIRSNSGTLLSSTGTPTRTFELISPIPFPDGRISGGSPSVLLATSTPIRQKLFTVNDKKTELNTLIAEAILERHRLADRRDNAIRKNDFDLCNEIHQEIGKCMLKQKEYQEQLGKLRETDEHVTVTDIDINLSHKSIMRAEMSSVPDADPDVTLTKRLCEQATVLNASRKSESEKSFLLPGNSILKALVTLLRFLSITKKITPFIRTLYESRIIPCLEDEDARVRAYTIKLYCLFAILDKTQAKQSLMVSLKALEFDILDAKVAGFKAVVDLLIAYSLPFFKINHGEENTSGLPYPFDTPDVSDEDLEQGILSILNTIGGRDPTEADMELRVTGIGKLFYTKRIKSPKLLADFLTMWIVPDPEEEDKFGPSSVKHAMAHFIRYFGMIEAGNASLVLDAFLIYINQISDSEHMNEDRSTSANLAEVAEYFAQYTSPFALTRFDDGYVVHEHFLQNCLQFIKENMDSNTFEVLLVCRSIKYFTITKPTTALVMRKTINEILDSDFGYIMDGTEIKKCLSQILKHLSRKFGFELDNLEDGEESESEGIMEDQDLFTVIPALPPSTENS